MGQVITLAREGESGDASHQELVDQLPIGLVWLDDSGAMTGANAAARLVLDGSAGERVAATVARLHAAYRDSPGLIHASVELGPCDRLHVSLSADRGGKGYLVALDRQKLERARAEAQALRAVLTAIAHSDSRAEASRRTLDAVRGLFVFENLALFELDTAGTHLVCAAAKGSNELDFARVGPLSVEPQDSLLSVAFGHQRTVHVRDLAMAPGPMPIDERPGLGAVLLPVRGRRQSGVLYVSAPPDALGESALGLMQALADALGALSEVAGLEAEATRAREIAAQRDRLATIGQLVAGVAHEINNPLAFLKSNLSSLKGDLAELREKPCEDTWQDVEENVSESIAGVSRIEQLVQALKGTARQRNEKVRFDPTRALSEAVTIFRGARKQECDIDCKLGQLPEVMGSPSGLGQVVLNLMQNGLDAMSGIDRRARKLEIKGDFDGQNVVLSVRDHGTGIPPSVQQRMFDAFYTTKDPGKGTGLGLYICREIVVETMGGRMEFTTGAEGTTFELTLPVADETLPPRPSP